MKDFQFKFSKIFLQGQRAVHHGGPGEQLHVQPGRGRDDHPGPDPQPQHPQAQQDDVTVCRVCCHGHQFWMLLGVHEDEAAGIYDVIVTRMSSIR